ncbi:hypothetical protein [Nitrosomonas sp. ANs5]|uniref:hypothetical protein n=1 Tax=Nitrosomonas sp. ANs5 TaxID=3423941 RepID=UPI003D32BEE8
MSKKKPTWIDLKRRLAELDHPALLGLIQDLYAASKNNQAFLHARFALGKDVLEPYKTTIDRWVCPDVMLNQDISIAKAKKAISDYKKAIGRPEGVAELTVFFCESCANFLGFCCVDYEEYFNALVRMFEQALKAVAALEPKQQKVFVERLERIRCESRNWGWGVRDDMDDLMAEYGFAKK